MPPDDVHAAQRMNLNELWLNHEFDICYFELNVSTVLLNECKITMLLWFIFGSPPVFFVVLSNILLKSAISCKTKNNVEAKAKLNRLCYVVLNQRSAANE